MKYVQGEGDSQSRNPEFPEALRGKTYDLRCASGVNRRGFARRLDSSHRLRHQNCVVSQPSANWATRVTGISRWAGGHLDWLLAEWRTAS